MSKSVLDLQNDCLNHSIPCSQLLLKAYAIARKLNIAEMVDFCKNELDGYQDHSDEIPNFRQVNTCTNLCNGYTWYIATLPFNLSLTSLPHSVKEMEMLCASKKEYINVKMSAEQIQNMKNFFNNPNIVDGYTLIFPYLLEGVIFKIRRTILEWALNLGEDGIWGDNLEFTSSELNKAQSITITNIFNAPSSGNNIIGCMTDSIATINNGFDFAKVTELINQISQNVKSLHLPEVQENELSSDISEIKDMIARKDEFGIRKVLKKIEGICQNIAGNVVAAGIIAHISSFLG
jgi:hypothetical protein